MTSPNDSFHCKAVKIEFKRRGLRLPSVRRPVQRQSGAAKVMKSDDESTFHPGLVKGLAQFFDFTVGTENFYGAPPSPPSVEQGEIRTGKMTDQAAEIEFYGHLNRNCAGAHDLQHFAPCDLRQGCIDAVASEFKRSLWASAAEFQREKWLPKMRM